MVTQISYRYSRKSSFVFISFPNLLHQWRRYTSHIILFSSHNYSLSTLTNRKTAARIIIDYIRIQFAIDHGGWVYIMRDERSSSANMNYSRSTLTKKNQISRKTLRVLLPSTLGRKKTKTALARATVPPSNKARANNR